MNFVVGIPTINRADLLNEALIKYNECWPTLEVYILDNGNQKIKTQNKNQKIFKTDLNIGVAASWNFLAERAFAEGYLRILMLNDDIELVKSEKEINQKLNKYPDHCLVVQEGKWCSFVLPKVVYDLVGPFDEIFYPAHFEDKDYAYRIKMHKYADLETHEVLNPTLHRHSISLKMDKTLNKDFTKNKNRFVAKWGGEPDKEKFKSPYNLPSME
tara:strand:+ start:6624 stop:7265 length:642 start_codon:yes stop_codon:yes gene_type:complete